MLHASLIARCGCLILLACAATLGDAKAAPAPLPRPSTRPGEYSMVQVPWEQVFRWIRERTRKPIIAGSIPPGTFTLVVPKNVRPAVPQVIEAVKAALAEQEQPYVLIARERNFVLVPADEKIDPNLSLNP